MNKRRRYRAKARRREYTAIARVQQVSYRTAARLWQSRQAILREMLGLNPR